MLCRSIYFLFHDEKAVHHIISELQREFALDDKRIRAITAQGHGLIEMPGVTVNTRSPETLELEQRLWHLSIGVFTVSLIALVTSLIAASWLLAAFLGVLVVAAQFSGYLFGRRISNAQLDRFRTGLEQGVLLLQIDVPLRDIGAVRSFVHSRYPDSMTNISNWYLTVLESLRPAKRKRLRQSETYIRRTP